jgi:DNA-binding NarL/FixJ family response regulator
MTLEKEMTEQNHLSRISHRGSGAIKTLVVDDSPFVRDGLQQLAARVPEIEIIGTANDGIDGVELALLSFPELVLMDFQMPRMDGLTAARLIRAGNEDIRIVLMTAHDLDKVKASGLCKHVDAVVGKQELPIQLATLVRQLFPYRLS